MGVLYNSRIVTDGLVLCLDAGDKMSYPGAGTTWTDLSKNRNNGTLVNGPTFNSANGGSIVFDGTDDYINIGSMIANINNAFTVEAYLRRTGNGTNWPRIFLNGQVNTSITITQYNNTTGVLFRIKPTSGSWIEYNLPTGTMVNNQWLSLSFSYEGSIMRAFINGVEYGSGYSISKTITTPTSENPYIGGDGNSAGDPSGSSFDGHISNVRVYNRALSAQEIQQNYKATKGRFGL